MVVPLIEVACSHHHWDHIGDLSQFPPETDLIVGPGFKSEYMPGYPTNQDAWITEKDYEYGYHKLYEVQFID